MTTCTAQRTLVFPLLSLSLPFLSLLRVWVWVASRGLIPACTFTGHNGEHVSSHLGSTSVFLTTLFVYFCCRMHRVAVHENGGPEVLVYEEVAIPQPGEGKLLVKNGAIGLNFIDVSILLKLFPSADGRTRRPIIALASTPLSFHASSDVKERALLKP